MEVNTERDIANIEEDKINILIVDEDVNVKVTISNILNDAGCIIEGAKNDKEAIEFIKKKEYEILMVDMKSIDGIEVVKQSKERNPELIFIVLTKHASLETAISAMNYGAYAYILKPLKEYEIKTIIKKAIRELKLVKRNRKLIGELRKSNSELEIANMKLKELTQIKSQFLANASHEFRTPLNSIIGFTNLLLDGLAGELNEKQIKFLNSIATNSKSLLEFINEILELAKIETGKLELNRSNFDIVELVNSTNKIVMPLLEEKNINFKIDVAEESIIVFGDEKRINQILLNLISNSIKFTPENGEISVSVKKLEEEIHISISDNGIGMAKENLEIIFEEFKRVSTSTKGYGLGLSIAKRIVELHNGKIWAESDGLGKGSKFTFSIPKYETDIVFKKYLEEKIGFVNRENKKLVIITVNIDEFDKIKKMFNPVEIHELLKKIEETIKVTTRKDTDTVIRFKRGEIVITAETDKDTALNISKRIKDSLKKSKFVGYEPYEKLNCKFTITLYPEKEVIKYG